MNAHNVLEKMIDIAYENWTPNTSFGIFIASTVTFSSIVTLMLCSKNDTTNDSDSIRLSALEHNIGSISSVLKDVSEEVETTSKQTTFRLDMQSAEQESIRNEMNKLKNNIEECLADSSSSE